MKSLVILLILATTIYAAPSEVRDHPARTSRFKRKPENVFFSSGGKLKNHGYSVVPFARGATVFKQETPTQITGGQRSHVYKVSPQQEFAYPFSVAQPAVSEVRAVGTPVDGSERSAVDYKAMYEALKHSGDYRSSTFKSDGTSYTAEEYKAMYMALIASPAYKSKQGKNDYTVTDYKAMYEAAVRSSGGQSTKKVSDKEYTAEEYKAMYMAMIASPEYKSKQGEKDYTATDYKAMYEAAVRSSGGQITQKASDKKYTAVEYKAMYMAMISSPEYKLWSVEEKDNSAVDYKAMYEALKNSGDYFSVRTRSDGTQYTAEDYKAMYMAMIASPEYNLRKQEK